MATRGVAVTLLVIAAVTACVRDQPVGVNEGDRFTYAQGGLEFVWLFRTDDCLTCQRFDLTVRRANEALGADIPFVGIHLGDEKDERIARQFFISRRIHADVRTMPLSMFSGTQHMDSLPIFLIVKDSIVKWSSIGKGGPGTTDPVALVRQLVGSGS